MARCELHKELDRATDDLEAFAQLHGVHSPTAKRKHNYVKALLAQIKDSGHYIGYDCPDE